MRRILFSLLLLAALTGLATSSRAQCPDNTGPAPDPATCPWTSTSGYYRMGSTNCYATVYYCWRKCSGVVQVWTYRVDPDLGNDCNGISPAQLIHYGSDVATVAVLTINGTSYPCNAPGEVVISYTPGCFTLHHNSTTGQDSYVGCSDYGCYCQKTCEACYNQGNWIYSNCQSTGPTGCSCNPDVYYSWPTETCISVACEQ